MSTKSTASRRIGALILAVPVLLTALSAGAQLSPVPPGWQPITNVPAEYEIGTEPARRPGGRGWVAASVKFVGREPAGAALLQQSIRAEDYRGRRVRLAGWMRTNADSYAQMWMRVDGAGVTQTSDYMLNRPLSGASDWQPYAIVLDVPRDAVGITFGVALTGAGQVWLDDLSFETVATEVATTGRPGHEVQVLTARAGARLAASAQRMAYMNAPLRPVNLDFEGMAIVAKR